jgi:hypothetical protein
MTQFEQYRWEDHLLRKGGWKFNLAVGAVALGALTGTCLDSELGLLRQEGPVEIAQLQEILG